MPVKKLREYLESHKIKYVTISHSAIYTAQEIFASAHIPGKELAKTVDWSDRKLWGSHRRVSENIEGQVDRKWL